VSFVHAPILARDRGLTVSEMRSTGSQDYVSQVAVRAETGSGSDVEVAGTLLGTKNAERVIQVWDFEVEIEPAPHMLFFIYEDRPGIIGKVGTILGEHEINIATMEVSRKAAGGDALMGLTVDSPVPPDVLRTVGEAIDAQTIRAVTLGS
jgi:D-3-phosphoglycerate dehydrogenase / 2-oxoglutarate reductase